MRDAVISGNGRFVAFTSAASNLVAGDTDDRRDVFVHGRSTHVTTRASVGTGDPQFGGIQIGPAISDDGRYVTFIRSDFEHGNGQEVFVRDRTAGVTRQVTVPFPEGEAAAMDAVISGDGAWVAFTATGELSAGGHLAAFGSSATDLGAGPGDGRPHLYVRSFPFRP